MHFEPRELTLRDGRTVRLRAVLPSDEEEILQAFDRMGTDARYMRFMSARHYVNVDRLRKVLASFPESGLALAATVPADDGIDIVGTASIMVAEQPGACEFAISIVDDWAGAGLGRILLEALIDVARERGLARVEGYVLASNRAMLGLANRVGFIERRDPRDPTIRIVTFLLDRPATPAP